MPLETIIVLISFFLGENPLIPYLTRGDIAVAGSGLNSI